MKPSSCLIDCKSPSSLILIVLVFFFISTVLTFWNWTFFLLPSCLAALGSLNCLQPCSGDYGTTLAKCLVLSENSLAGMSRMLGNIGRRRRNLICETGSHQKSSSSGTLYLKQLIPTMMWAPCNLLLPALLRDQCQEDKEIHINTFISRISN